MKGRNIKYEKRRIIREEMDKMFALREHDYKFIKDYVSHFIV